MKTNPLLEELWRVKDDLSREAGYDIDGGAARAAVLRAHVVGHHLELGNGVGRQLHHLVRKSLV